MNETLQKVVDSLPVIRLLYDRPVYLVVLDDKGEVLGYSVPAGDKPKLRKRQIRTCSEIYGVLL